MCASNMAALAMEAIIMMVAFVRSFILIQGKYSFALSDDAVTLLLFWFCYKVLPLIKPLNNRIPLLVLPSNQILGFSDSEAGE